MKKILWNNYIARTLLTVGFFFGHYLTSKTTCIGAMTKMGMNANFWSVWMLMLMVAAINTLIFELIIRAAFGFLQNYSGFALNCDKETFARTLRFWQILRLFALSVFNLILIFYPLATMLLVGAGSMAVSLIFYSLFYLDLENSGHVNLLMRRRLIKILGTVLLVYYGYIVLISVLL